MERNVKEEISNAAQVFIYYCSVSMAIDGMGKRQFGATELITVLFPSVRIVK